MTSKQIYLNQGAAVEPLVNQWYAWSYLIPPASAAMYVANSHLKIMQSFVSAPQVHAVAVRNPKMSGGPFVDYDASAVEAIRRLIDKTTKERSNLLKLAEGIRSLDEALAREGDGHTLEPLYAKVPDVLRGCVELVYDLNNRPSMRLIEGVIYSGPLYNPSYQTIALSAAGVRRRFAMTNPRLTADRQLHLDVPFADERLDHLSRMRTTSQDPRLVRDLFRIERDQEESFSCLFTEQGPRPRRDHQDEQVHLRLFAGGCMLIEFKGISVLIDPVIGSTCDRNAAGLTYADLPEQIDYVLISQNDPLHFSLETLLQLRFKIKVVIVPKNNGGTVTDPSLKLMLRRIGFKHVTDVDELESHSIDAGEITGLPLIGGRGDLDVRTKLAYLIRVKGKTILCACQSSAVESSIYDRLRDVIGKVEVLFLGMNCQGVPLSRVYGPVLTKTLARKEDLARQISGGNYDSAMSILDRVRPKQVYLYATGEDPSLSYLSPQNPAAISETTLESERLVTALLNRGLVAERVRGTKEVVL